MCVWYVCGVCDVCMCVVCDVCMCMLCVCVCGMCVSVHAIKANHSVSQYYHAKGFFKGNRPIEVNW